MKCRLFYVSAETFASLRLCAKYYVSAETLCGFAPLREKITSLREKPPMLKSAGVER